MKQKTIEEIVDGEFTAGRRHVWVAGINGRTRKPINYAHRIKPH